MRMDTGNIVFTLVLLQTNREKDSFELSVVTHLYIHFLSVLDFTSDYIHKYEFFAISNGSSYTEKNYPIGLLALITTHFLLYHISSLRFKDISYFHHLFF